MAPGGPAPSTKECALRPLPYWLRYGNPYDPNAVAIWVQRLIVGHLSRENARRYRPGLLRLQDHYGQPIALNGVIVGGGIREDGPGRLRIPPPQPS